MISFPQRCYSGLPRAEILHKFRRDRAAPRFRVHRSPVNTTRRMYLRLAFSVAAHPRGRALVDEVLAVGPQVPKKCLGRCGHRPRGGPWSSAAHNMVPYRLVQPAIVFGRAGLSSTDRPTPGFVSPRKDLADTALTCDLAALHSPRGSRLAGPLDRVTGMTVRGDGFSFAEPLRFRWRCPDRNAESRCAISSTTCSGRVS